MQKWKVIIPVIVVVALGAFAYMRMAPRGEAPAEPSSPAMMAEDTGPSTGDADVDALVDDIVGTLQAEGAVAESSAEDASIAAEADSDAELFTDTYYEE